jgi:hypothetical protein
MQSIRVNHTALESECLSVWVRLDFGEQHVTDRFFTISTPVGLEDGGAVAELTALYHCLCVEGVFGASRSGRGLRIVVSAGVIRKLFLQRSTKVHLLPYAHFLVVRFAEACVRVEKRPGTPEHTNNASNLEAGLGNHEVWPTCAGDLVLTRHAIERYAQKVSPEGLDRSWHRLLRLLTRGTGNRLSVDEGEPSCERWRFTNQNHPPLTVVVARESLANKVVTVYP